MSRNLRNSILFSLVICLSGSTAFALDNLESADRLVSKALEGDKEAQQAVTTAVSEGQLSEEALGMRINHWAERKGFMEASESEGSFGDITRLPVKASAFAAGFHDATNYIGIKPLSYLKLWVREAGVGDAEAIRQVHAGLEAGEYLVKNSVAAVTAEQFEANKTISGEEASLVRKALELDRATKVMETVLDEPKIAEIVLKGMDVAPLMDEYTAVLSNLQAKESATRMVSVAKHLEEAANPQQLRALANVVARKAMSKERDSDKKTDWLEAFESRHGVTEDSAYRVSRFRHYLIGRLAVLDTNAKTVESLAVTSFRSSADGLKPEDALAAKDTVDELALLIEETPETNRELREARVRMREALLSKSLDIREAETDVEFLRQTLESVNGKDQETKIIRNLAKVTEADRAEVLALLVEELDKAEKMHTQVARDDLQQLKKKRDAILQVFAKIGDSSHWDGVKGHAVGETPLGPSVEAFRLLLDNPTQQNAETAQEIAGNPKIFKGEAYANAVLARMQNGAIHFGRNYDGNPLEDGAGRSAISEANPTEADAIKLLARHIFLDKMLETRDPAMQARMYTVLEQAAVTSPKDHLGLTLDSALSLFRVVQRGDVETIELEFADEDRVYEIDVDLRRVRARSRVTESLAGFGGDPAKTGSRRKTGSKTRKPSDTRRPPASKNPAGKKPKR